MSAARRSPRAGPRGRTRERSGASVATDAELVLGTEEATLLDLVDNVLNRGVVLTGDVTIGLAQVDLVYARLSLVLCAVDRILPGEDPEPLVRHAARARARRARRRA
jgi:hypothetical protein